MSVMCMADSMCAAEEDGADDRINTRMLRVMRMMMLLSASCWSMNRQVMHWQVSYSRSA